MGSIWQFFHFILIEKWFWYFQNPRFSIGLFEFLKMFYPPKGLCKAEPNGVHLTVFPFYCVWETVLTLSKSSFSIDLFEFLKRFPRREPKEVQLSLLIYYFGLGNVYGTIVSGAVIHLFEILKMFFAAKGLCEAEPNGVHLTVFPFNVLGKGFDTFKILIFHRPFWNLENVLSSEGSLH